ncbi:NAD(P)/FAD-dependent oxidoreductase [Verrucomicrobiota bacterium]
MGQPDLVIIGGGAAGLMAGCAAVEFGLRAVVLERKHKPGRKLLMCGNGRCNLTSDISTEEMLSDFGASMDDFLRPALSAFTPQDQIRWFARNGVPVMHCKDGKIFPRSEKASDVLYCFTDQLTDGKTPLCLNTSVQSIEKNDTGFTINTSSFSLSAPNVLVATGGVSYPKTGSTGDGQQWAEKLGHSLHPMLPGLVGFEVQPCALSRDVGARFPNVTLQVFANGKPQFTSEGLLEVERWGIGGGAITNASRIITRRDLQNVHFEIDLGSGKPVKVKPVRIRSIKEAMVTVGGVALSEIDSQTMQSKKCPGLYFAGEVMDVDGPTGGYNLSAAFATARLAVKAVAGV